MKQLFEIKKNQNLKERSQSYIIAKTFVINNSPTTLKINQTCNKPSNTIYIFVVKKLHN